MGKLLKFKEKSVTKEKSIKDKEENEISSITEIVVRFCGLSKTEREKKKGRENEKMMIPESKVRKMLNILKILLEQDRQNSLSPANNLKYIHNQLSQLEKSRYNMRQDYYKLLEEFSKDFDSYLWELTRKIITFVNDNDWQAKTIIAQLVKIIEEKDAVSRDSGSTSNTLNEIIIIEETRKIKSYKEKFSETLKDSVTEKFGSILNKEKRHPLAIIDKLEFVYEDLKSINNQIAPQFPNINQELVLTYHKNVYSLLDSILQNKPDAETILRLIWWVHQYHIIVLVRLKISKDLLKPQLLDGREQELPDEYINIMRSKIQEWKPNLINNNIEEFIKRAQNLDIIDENQLFRLTETSITITMINQTVQIAIKSAHEKILIETIKECFQVMMDLQQDVNRTLESESLKYIENTPPDNFIEYVLALANDQLRYADFIEKIVKRTQTTQILSKEYIYEIKEKTSSISDGCYRLANNAIDAVMKIIYNETDEFVGLHTSLWYKEPENFMEVIIEKLTDYTDHYRPHLKLYLFDKFIRTMAQLFVIAYIESMIKNGIKYKMPQCLDLIKQDIQEAREYFEIYLDPKELKQQFDPILKLLKFLTTNEKRIEKDYNSIKNAYGDVPRKLIKKILSKRSDLKFKRIQLRELKKIIKIKELTAEKYTGEPTIFSKVIIKQEDALHQIFRF
ncbi:hypothetical protein Glove_508g45 [Diversispora epigaea]|uniref:Uncharacterized protein n=1 Tax=Diversispora epigaea TaxID=1348612 RepID=A0A397GIJ9_9GLOM|nr:hypothetical protein Glove_508g45 [Diversispora epigaea]